MFQSSATRIVKEIKVFSDKSTGKRKGEANVECDSVKQVLEKHPGVTDVLVVAILGPSKKGKSFLLNLMAIYLRHAAVSSSMVYLTARTLI